MKTPDTKAGKLTESIMFEIAPLLAKDCYNMVYGRVLTVLENEFNKKQATIEDIKRYNKEQKFGYKG